MIDDFIYIGQVRKTHGVRGMIRLYIEHPFETDFVKSDFIYIDINGDFVPFFFETKEGAEHFYLVKFDDLNTPEEAKKMASFGIYMTRNMLSPETIDLMMRGENNFASKFDGYKIAVSGTEQLLDIVSIVEYPHQWLASVIFNEREILIPLVDAFIVDQNEDDKILKMDLPDGMLG